MRKNCFVFLVPFLLAMTMGNAYAQKRAPKKYPSLFWEITGKGLAKPSYLFGTMHVSSKMVFHLSDSFYYAMKNVDAVALELNPDIWQGQMVTMDRLKQNYANFIQASTGDYLTENSFRLNSFDTDLKAALNSAPTVVNSLLYRSYKAREDFEEDTFLDLYIFQTGKKLGKRATGVEDYYETEKVVLEAYADMAKEKKKKNIDTDGESFRDIGQKIQDAYRSGDLDLMDSLDLVTERSDAFREKFLYKRNEIQAMSIDTIIKKNSLFVGVGAAHLAGPRGIIELLRKMGYSLRPIKMSDRDAARKEETDQLKVPVVFNQVYSDDGFFSVSMPGPLFKMRDESQRLDRRQYSDMSNGAYYLVTRVKTYAAFLGQTEDAVFKKIDSLLYENIPGKILKKTLIRKNGYKGYDITNRTRRGDLQRYNIFITPFEVLFFKMSGKENYVDGKEATQFFSSIHIKERNSTALLFTPAQGGFSVKLPEAPHENHNIHGSDEIDRWEYQAVDKTTGNAYLILKKSVHNYKFLEEDSFDVKLIETSFRNPELFSKQLSRNYSSFMGNPVLQVKELMQDGSVVEARYILNGPHQYVIAVRSKDSLQKHEEFFNSFKLGPYKYGPQNQYIDTFLHFSVNTPIAPELDESYRAKLEKVTAEIAHSSSYSNYNSYWPKNRNAIFRSDSTGECITVTIQQYPKYYTVKDSTKFWINEVEDYNEDEDFLLAKKDSFTSTTGVHGYDLLLTDTGSSRTIRRKIMLKDNFMFSLVTLGDTLKKESDFVNKFFQSFSPEDRLLGRTIFKDNLDSFFVDLFSSDSLTHTRAEQVISNIYYGEKGVSKLMNAIRTLPAGKNYLENKTKLISELGYIKDSTKKVIVKSLKEIYEKAGDTSIFQNEVMKALARHQSKDAIKLFKQLILQDPPLFENNYDYTGMFMNLGDSLELAAQLYPELLQLSNVDDYKKPVISLLVTLVDSGLVKEKQLNEYFSKLYFDAKIELKKQQGKDQKKLGIEGDEEDGDDDVVEYNRNENEMDLNDYAVLLLPFYTNNINVPKFFDKLLQSKDEMIRLKTSITLIRHQKPVPDSVINWFATKDQWRGKLFQRLEKIKRTDLFPPAFKTQLDMARSLMVADKNSRQPDSIIFLSKALTTFEGKQGWAYFFKYRIKQTDDWKIGISGLQPVDVNTISSDDKLSLLTERKLKSDRSQEEQLQEQLTRLLFESRKSAKNFYDADEGSFRIGRIDGLED